MKNETKYKSLEEMSRKKRKALTIAGEEFHFVDGLKDFLTQIYTSSGHFVYELLQNAEDENAREVIFELFEDKLVVSHDGDKLFDLIDIDSITDVFDSAKTFSKFKEGNPIGKYGVGFKSVFEYTQEPEILSGKYHFKIEKMFIPQKIDDDFYEKTKFILPLGTDKKTPDACKREVEKALFELPFDTLLFLKNINTVKCIYKNKIITLKRNDNISDYFNNLCTITYDSDTELKEYAFLRFFKEINIKTSDDEVEKKTEIAIAYQIEQSYFTNNEITLKPILIDNVPKGKVYTFFPCEKETSNLCFHIHAQFALQPTRESFRDDKGNMEIINEIGNLVCESIRILKEKELLDENVLCVLPNRNDSIDNKYSVIRDKVLDLFNNEPFVLMKNDTFEPAKGKFIGKKELQEILFPEEEMKILFNSDKNSYWIKVPFWKGRDRAFINSLQIENFSIETFINKIKDYFYNNSSYYKEIINHYENKNIEWFKKLYIELNNASEYYYMLKPLSLYLCEDGKLHNALNCYRKQKNFDVSSFIDDKVFIDPRIFIDEDRKTVISIKHFFDNLDIKEFGKKEYQSKFLEDYEKKDVSLKKVEDIITFYEWYIKDKYDYNSTDIISILKEQQFLLKSKDGEWESARYLYFPEEFNYSISNISIYYEDFYNRNFIGVGFSKNEEYRRYKNLLETKNDKIKQMLGLSIDYLQILNDNPNIDRNNFLNFLKELGVKDCVDVFKTDCHQNDYHIEIERSVTKNYKSIDEDYDIPFLSSMLEISNDDIFNFIWSLLKKINCDKYAFCKYGNKTKPLKFHSQLVNVLRKSLWVKQVNKGEISFTKPQDATIYNLPNNLDNELGFDENLSNWIKKILEFGENIKNNKKDIKDLSERVGIPEAQINILKEMNNLPETERKEAEEKFAEFKNYVFSRKYKNLNENSENINIGHIKERAVESIRNASNITRSLKETSRRDHYSDTKKLAKPYLVSKYTNTELQQIICQICGQPMPFKCKDGSDYFETTQIFTENLMPAEGVYQNYMALCPVCGARYKEYIFHSEEKQKKLFHDILNSKDDDITFEIDLDKKFQVCFEQAHIIALRIMLKTLKQEGKIKEDNNFDFDIDENILSEIFDRMKEQKNHKK